jgi:hypothetical protein
MRVIKRLEDKIENYIRSYVFGKLHQQRYEYRLLCRNDMAKLKRTLRPADVKTPALEPVRVIRNSRVAATVC